jgi:hypothetical protein
MQAVVMRKRQKLRLTDVRPASTITMDLVPVYFDAVLLLPEFGGNYEPSTDCRRK